MPYYHFNIQKSLNSKTHLPPKLQIKDWRPISYRCNPDVYSDKWVNVESKLQNFSKDKPATIRTRIRIFLTLPGLEPSANTLKLSSSVWIDSWIYAFVCSDCIRDEVDCPYVTFIDHCAKFRKRYLPWKNNSKITFKRWYFSGHGFNV